MLSTWQPDIISKALEFLTDQERMLIDLYINFPDGPPKSTLTKLGFDPIAFEQAAHAALLTARMWFAAMGIGSISDLTFPEPDRTLEGRLSMRPKAVKRPTTKKPTKKACEPHRDSADCLTHASS
jgi:hypothetical protein